MLLSGRRARRAGGWSRASRILRFLRYINKVFGASNTKPRCNCLSHWEAQWTRNNYRTEKTRSTELETQTKYQWSDMNSKPSSNASLVKLVPTILRFFSILKLFCKRKETTDFFENQININAQSWSRTERNPKTAAEHRLGLSLLMRGASRNENLASFIQPKHLVTSKSCC